MLQVPDGVRQEAKAPGKPSFLPQAQSSNGTFERHWDWPVPKVKLTERDFTCLWEREEIFLL